MINEKKLKMAYKKYSRNFVDGIKFDDVKEYYSNSKSKIESIVELNDIDKDHVLLIRLGSISDYYLSQWKDAVLSRGGNKADGLKEMQMIVLYKCIAQELYKIRYPGMRVRYSFEEVIGALVHFTMFGWEKEENILFDFIVEYFGEHLMDANEPYKSSWFLLELYLQYRNKTLMGTNQKLHLAVKEKLKETGRQYGLIPNDLDIYSEVLEKWSTRNEEEIGQLIAKMVTYHSTQVSEIGEVGEFGEFVYGFYPYEILFLIHARKKLGLAVPQLGNDFLMNTPEAKMVFENLEPYPEWDPLLRLIDNFYRKNYPQYIPNRHGQLFQ